MIRELNIPIVPELAISEAIQRNPRLLLMLEYLEIPLGVQDKSIYHICKEAEIEIDIFLIIANMYAGIHPDTSNSGKKEDISIIIKYLENSHRHYINEKFPLLTSLINDICKVNIHPEIELLKKFFDEYLDEVADHLKYENTVVFPYISSFSEEKTLQSHSNNKYSISEYRRHHDDIEEKLTDLKNLLIKYLPPHNDMPFRRKLLLTLDELEHDLHIHSLIEENVLIPIVEKFENKAG